MSAKQVSLLYQTRVACGSQHVQPASKGELRLEQLIPSLICRMMTLRVPTFVYLFHTVTDLPNRP